MAKTREQEGRFSHLLASRPQKEGKAAASAMVVSVLVHLVIVGALVWATAAIGSEAVAEEEITLIRLPPEALPPPPPPPPPASVETPPKPETADVPKGFQTLVAPEIVPPDIPPPLAGVEINAEDFTGEGVKGGRGKGKAQSGRDITAAPVLTPYTIAPRLENRREIARALVRLYPPRLKQAGIGGTVLMWFLIDEEGRVVKTQVKESSGSGALDAAALEVARKMRFSPAYNMDVKVKVWVALPIVFRTR